MVVAILLCDLGLVGVRFVVLGFAVNSIKVPASLLIFVLVIIGLIAMAGAKPL